MRRYFYIFVGIALAIFLAGCYEEENGSEFPFRKTRRFYSEYDDLDSAIQSEFGSDYRIADWNDVKAYCEQHSAREFIEQLQWELGGEYSLIVTRNGEHFWGGTARHYFITRFDHDVDDNYLVHDDIESGYITLGSWFDLHMRILAIRER